MNQEEALQLSKRLETYEKAMSAIIRVDKILTMLDAFISDRGEREKTHPVGLLLIDPNTDELTYLTHEYVRTNVLRGQRIWSLTTEENIRFCEAFFTWARLYFEQKKIEAENAVKEA